MVQMDITDIQYPDNVFDIIYCSHVLEHVPDDRKAMRELSRVLKPDGFAVIMVPITVDHTIEDPTVDSPSERERRFGQHDHVLCYGPDFKDRLEESGFGVRTIECGDVATAEETLRMKLAQTDTIFHCHK